MMRTAALKRVSLLLALVMATPLLAAEIDLAGTWQFSLDPEDIGMAEAWFARSLPDTIQLPGTLQEQGYGNEITATTPWVGRLYDKYWYLRREFKKYAQPGRIQVPFWLQPERHYVGAAWYRRAIEIPESWRDRRVVVHFERAHWSTTVWLDERPVGTNDCLSAPHEYDLGILKPGRYMLTVRVDNRMLQDIREDAHSITDSTQTNWNGLIGELKLISTTPVWLDEVRVFTDIARRAVRFEAAIGNRTGRDGEGTLTCRDVSVPVRWTAEGGLAQVEVLLGKEAALWDEFNPVLHKLTVELKGDNADDRREMTVGLREIRTQDARFYFNGRRLFLRGTHEGCQFPLTGYPPTDVESWRKIFRVCREYGLNHMRFHSWCPPEAAFAAADEMGMYLQPECSNWGQYSSRNNRLVEWLERETAALIRAYGNHPSFVLLSSGNEAAGPWQEPLKRWCADWKRRDNRRLYCATSGRDLSERPGPVEDIDYLVAGHIGRYMLRGVRGWDGRDFARSLEGNNYPCISHELGQWCAFPDFGEMEKYTGTLKPKNFEIFRDRLEEQGLLDRACDFLMDSGALQVECYKQDIEAILRTPGMGGFQLLDLHDYPGQGTALVGPLNVFWQSKGYVTPERFRRFCNVTVPLARMRRTILTTDEPFVVEAEIAHFGAEPIADARPVWRITDADGKSVAKGAFARLTIPVENGTKLGTVEADLSRLPAPAKYRLVIGLEGTAVENNWEFWLYPAKLDTKPAPSIVITRSFEEAVRLLEEGRRVLFMPPYNQLRWDCPPIGDLPIFWNRLMGPQWERFLGLTCDPGHPALAGFVTDSHYGRQWGEVFSPPVRAINMDGLPRGLRPIVQMIDDWNRSYKLGAVFECKVGTGKLLVCAADLETHLDRRPAARQLRRSLLDYMAGERFNPTVEVAPQALLALQFDNRIMKKLGAVALADEDNGSDTPQNAIDGNPNTFWLTQRRGYGRPYPHELTIRFESPVPMRGLVWMNRQNHREHEGDICEYAIDIREDGGEWTEIKAGRMESAFDPQTINFGRTVTAQHLRIRALSGFGGDTAASLAEIAVLYDGPPIITDEGPVTPYRGAGTATEEIFESPAAPQSESEGAAPKENPSAGQSLGKIAPKPLYRDPIYDGAADPVLCWNRQEHKWFMFYTNRRANVPGLRGVSWVHGAPIGIAESSDGGVTWTYRATADIGYGEGEFSYWAPDVIHHDGTYHMYLSFVPGMHTDWSGTRDIIHLTSPDLCRWHYQSTLDLASDRVIDATVCRLADGTWRLWYNNESDRKSIYYADSPDLYHWQDKGKALSERGEGPKVFRWKDRYWLVMDVWQGLRVFNSPDALHWTPQTENLLEKPGSGPDDQVKGGHADVVVSGDRAWLFYFTHPGRRGPEADKDTSEQRRSSIQVVELEYGDGKLTCARNRPTRILLGPAE